MNEQTAPTTKATTQGGLVAGPSGTKVRLTRTQAAKAAAAAQHSGLKVPPGSPETPPEGDADGEAQEAGQEGGDVADR